MKRPDLCGISFRPPVGFNGHLALSPAVDLLTAGGRPDLLVVFLAEGMRVSKARPGATLFEAAGRAFAIHVGAHIDGTRAVWLGSAVELGLSGPDAVPRIFEAEAEELQ